MEHANPNLDLNVEDLRSTPRRNLLVLGSLTWDGNSKQVRIRNISVGGALLEIADIPADLRNASLIFGAESHQGSIVWRSSNRIGFQFDKPREFTAAERVPTIGQARVDRHIYQAREELDLTDHSNGSKDTDRSDLRISEELLYIQRRMESLGDVLSGDPILIVKYQRQLQDIDIIMQTLGHVSRVVSAPDREAAIGAIGMEELRRRLSR